MVNVIAEKFAHVAAEMARDMHENNFPSRRGLFALEGEDALCVYDNNPYARAPGLRDKVLAKLGAWCEESGMRVVAEGAFGDDDGQYTKAMIIEGGCGREGDIGDQWRALLQRAERAFDAN